MPHFHSQFNGEVQNAPNNYRQRYDTHNEQDELQTRIDDMKNRIELRRMLSEYTSGSLKPPIFYKDGIAAPDDYDQNDEIEAVESILEEQPPQRKRFFLPSQHNQVHQSNDEMDNYDEFPLKSIFREHQRPQYIVEDVEDQNEFDRRNNDPNEYHRRLFKANRGKEQSPVYTEGGLVYAPGTHLTTTQRKRKSMTLTLTLTLTLY